MSPNPKTNNPFKINEDLRLDMEQWPAPPDDVAERIIGRALRASDISVLARRSHPEPKQADSSRAGSTQMRPAMTSVQPDEAHANEKAPEMTTAPIEHYETLSTVVEALADQIRTMSKRAQGNPEPVLFGQYVEVCLSYEVSRSSQGKVEFKVPFMGAAATGQSASKHANTITIRLSLTESDDKDRRGLGKK